MLKTYSLRKRILFSALLLALLSASAYTAQAMDIRQVRAALTGHGGGFGFSFAGRMSGTPTPETLLIVDSVNDAGAFTGKYYPYSGPAPSADNVSGTITIINGEAIRITFTVRAQRTGGVIAGTTTFEGALRLSTGDSSPSFMAGTYTIGRAVPAPGRAPGPYPFCATFLSIPDAP